MLRSTDRILTSHVGSLVRPVDVMEFQRAKQARQGYNETAYAERLNETIDAVVAQQAQRARLLEQLAHEAGLLRFDLLEAR